MDRGTYIEYHGRPAVRFERTYGHPVERVWEAVATPEGLAHWFPSAVALEPYVGGKITFSGDPNMEGTTGEVLEFEPPRRLAFSWSGDELRFELEAVDGGCRFTLINVLEARDTAARNAAGWTVCLAELGGHLAGEPVAGPHSESATPWRPVYEEYVASGMPSGAPIPGEEDEHGEQGEHGE
ncbi:SRPBCC family protein [Sphaerisporangium aureirubrum]|uniref:SRPBCC family protein n=1 Tax=Sphaerisporangium aureirubrum TaxID=1544736 RepID=A0ABW1NM72_9ACTN